MREVRPLPSLPKSAPTSTALATAKAPSTRGHMESLGEQMLFIANIALLLFSDVAPPFKNLICY